MSIFFMIVSRFSPILIKISIDFGTSPADSKVPVEKSICQKSHENCEKEKHENCEKESMVGNGDSPYWILRYIIKYQ